MKYLQLVILSVLFSGCDFNREPTNSGELVEDDSVHIASFRIGNTEIREEIISELVKYNIQHWVNDDKSISYLSSDGEAIDKIGNEVIMAYISRN